MREKKHDRETEVEIPVEEDEEIPQFDDFSESEGEKIQTDVRLEQLESENAELQDKNLRLMAEFENFRKRQERILAEMIEQERNNIIGRLLDIADDVMRAATSARTKCDPELVMQGIEMISQRISELLHMEGVVAEDPTGEKFDPLEQEAVGVLPADSPDNDGIIIEAIHPTYKRDGRVIRPAKVFVAKFSEKSNTASEKCDDDE